MICGEKGSKCPTQWVIHSLKEVIDTVATLITHQSMLVCHGLSLTPATTSDQALSRWTTSTSWLRTQCLSTPPTLPTRTPTLVTLREWTTKRDPLRWEKSTRAMASRLTPTLVALVARKTSAMPLQASRIELPGHRRSREHWSSTTVISTVEAGRHHNLTWSLVSFTVEQLLRDSTASSQSIVSVD